jgi:hypothetical protein
MKDQIAFRKSCTRAGQIRVWKAYSFPAAKEAVFKRLKFLDNEEVQQGLDHRQSQGGSMKQLNWEQTTLSGSFQEIHRE